jgi:hypothetical protein
MSKTNLESVETLGFRTMLTPPCHHRCPHLLHPKGIMQHRTGSQDSYVYPGPLMVLVVADFKRLNFL